MKIKEKIILTKSTNKMQLSEKKKKKESFGGLKLYFIEKWIEWII